MWRVGGWKKFLIACIVDLAIFAVALSIGAPLKYAIIGLGVVALLEWVLATV